jgi:hypothetical protein
MNRSPKKLKSELRQWKCMMIVALWKKQVLTYQILPEGQSVDSIAYLNFLEHRVLPEVNRKKWQSLLYYMIMLDHTNIE